MELYYMNKTNIIWLRDNRELYFIEIEIKRGVAHYLRRPQTGFVIALGLPNQNPDIVLNRMRPGFFMVQQKTRETT